MLGVFLYCNMFKSKPTVSEMNILTESERTQKIMINSSKNHKWKTELLYKNKKNDVQNLVMHRKCFIVFQ